jgi:hypothetical protein
MDRRDRDFKWWSELNERKMLALPNWVHPDEESETDFGYSPDRSNWIPVKYEKCETCDGKGKHVNPSIDAHGLSSDDFAEDPQFAEDYFNGMYDVECRECEGRRVAIEVDRDRATPEQVKSIEDWFQEQADDYAVRRAENGWQY